MHLIIVGCGRVGAELANSVASKGHDVVIIDRDPQAFDRLDPEFRGHTLQGDVREKEVWNRAGSELANGFAAVTPIDEINLVSAHTARDVFNIPNVVARVYDPVHAPLFKRAGIQTVNASLWIAHRIEQLLVYPGLIELASLGNGEVLVVEVQIPDHLVGENVAALVDSGSCLPVALVHGGYADLVSPDMILKEGELAVVAIRSSMLPHLENLLKLETE